MKAVLIVFAACVACGWCATQGLSSVPLRPTPINPAVISEPKPADKITVIKDPKEVEKVKREAPQKGKPPVASAPLKGPTPSSLPKRPQLLKPTPPPPAPVRPGPPKKDAPKHRQKREHDHEHHHKEEATVKPEPLIHRHAEPETVAQKPEQPHNHKRDIPVPLVPKFEHPAESAATDEATSKKPVHSDDVQVEDLSHIQVVPLKKHHSDEVVAATTSGSTTTTTTGATTNSGASSASASSLHPAVRPHPVPVSELFARPIPKSQN